MVDLARRNAESAELRNIEFVVVGQPSELPVGPFDFVCSLSVFRHIPALQGYELIRSLARLLAPGGVAAIQVPLITSRSRARLRSGLRRLMMGSVSRVDDAGTRAGEGSMNLYNRRYVSKSFQSVDARTVACFADDRGASDAVLIFHRAPIVRPA